MNLRLGQDHRGVLLPSRSAESGEPAGLDPFRNGLHVHVFPHKAGQILECLFQWIGGALVAAEERGQDFRILEDTV